MTLWTNDVLHACARPSTSPKGFNWSPRKSITQFGLDLVGAKLGTRSTKRSAGTALCRVTWPGRMDNF